MDKCQVCSCTDDRHNTDCPRSAPEGEMQNQAWKEYRQGLRDGRAEKDVFALPNSLFYRRGHLKGYASREEDDDRYPPG